MYTPVQIVWLSDFTTTSVVHYSYKTEGTAGIREMYCRHKDESQFRWQKITLKKGGSTQKEKYISDVFKKGKRSTGIV